MGEKIKVEGAEKKNESSIVLKLDLHCEGCAQKLRRFIRHTHGKTKLISIYRFPQFVFFLIFLIRNSEFGA